MSKEKKLLKAARAISHPFRVTDGEGFRLSDHDPCNTLDFTNDDKQRGKEALAEGVRALAALQDKLYAQDRWGVLLIFQAMDAAGKDGAIKHVMSGVNPQGCQVFSFKSPSAEDLDHDYLWRCMKCLPERGRIGIFNRSYYEEVLVVKVHDELLRKQKLPTRLLESGKLFKHRYEDIANFETYLAHNGIAVCKFFLNLSKKEQKKRFMERLDNPDKNWKFSSSDAKERERWDDYQKAYETMIRRTASESAPWYVVPADNKWFSRLVVAAAVIDTLSGLDLAYPEVDDEKRKELALARELLESPKGGGEETCQQPVKPRKNGSTKQRRS